jgi:hypothetical protein
MANGGEPNLAAVPSAREDARFWSELVRWKQTSLITRYWNLDDEIKLYRAIAHSNPKSESVYELFNALVSDKLARAMSRSKSVILPPGARRNSSWNTYQGTEALQAAVSKLLLPDVSSLPLEAIGELRDRLKDVLDPMRGELLRLTEDLRKLVDGKTDLATIGAEAENLVATRVEPLVRDADHRARELANRKWRKLFTSAAKAFGFAGASFIDAKLIGKAVQQTLETTAMTLGNVEDKTPGPKMTAQFVLEARSFIVAAGPHSARSV